MLWGMSILVVGCASPAAPTAPASRAVLEEQDPGIRVARAIQAFYNSVPDPLFVFGEPLTPPQQQAPGRWVQFFEKAVLVSDAQGQVRPEPLGRRYRVPGTPYLERIQGGPSCREYGEFQVCYAFLDVYLKYGGERIFGPPISNMETNGVQIFQDFENARLIFHFAAPERIVVADLGKLALQEAMDQFAQGPVFNMGEALQVQVTLSVEQPQLTAGDTQTITILVLDQNDQPLTDAEVWVEILTQDGRSLGRQPVGPPNDNGVIQFQFRVPEDYEGWMYVKAEARYQGETYEARRMFRVQAP